jgi:hypothetical protein
MIIPILIVAGLRAGPVPAFDAELELEKSIHREIVLGDPLGAIDQYRVIVAHREASNEVVARALLHLGGCQDELGRRNEARDSYSHLIRDYGDQTPIVAKARARLAGWEDLQPGPRNLDFRLGIVGKVPPGWIVPALPKDADFLAELRRVGCRSGAGCAMVRVPTNAPSPVANLMQSFGAEAYRGKTVRLRAWLKLESVDPQDRAQMFLSVDRNNRQIGFFDNMNDRPIRSLEWTRYEIAGPVDRDASFINFGFMSIGKGTVWVDEVSFEIVK